MKSIKIGKWNQQPRPKGTEYESDINLSQRRNS